MKIILFFSCRKLAITLSLHKHLTLFFLFYVWYTLIFTQICTICSALLVWCYLLPCNYHNSLQVKRTLAWMRVVVSRPLRQWALDWRNFYPIMWTWDMTSGCCSRARASCIMMRLRKWIIENLMWKRTANIYVDQVVLCCFLLVVLVLWKRMLSKRCRAIISSWITMKAPNTPRSTSASPAVALLPRPVKMTRNRVKTKPWVTSRDK